MMRTWRWQLGVVVAPIALGALAAASDLSGTWTGKVSCRGTFDGVPQTTTSASTLLVEDGGTSLTLAVDGVHYNGASYPAPANPAKGEIAVIRCDTNSTRSADFGGEFGRLRVMTNASTGKGTLAGTTLKASVLVGRTLSTCHWAFKRISAAPVVLGPCTAPTPP